MERKTCTFTGHRPQNFPWRNNEDDARCVALRQILADEVSKMVKAGVTDFLSGMALGVDCWAALEVLALREVNPALRLHCILPCKSQAQKWAEPAKGVVPLHPGAV